MIMNAYVNLILAITCFLGGYKEKKDSPSCWQKNEKEGKRNDQQILDLAWELQNVESKDDGYTDCIW